LTGEITVSAMLDDVGTKFDADDIMALLIILGPIGLTILLAVIRYVLSGDKQPDTNRRTR
jgi:hypothetical protein